MEIMSELKQRLSLDEIFQRGEEIYQGIKHQYEPRYNGKFLIIDVESGKAYMDDFGARAEERALAEKPDGLFHLVRIGFDFVYTIASFNPSRVSGLAQNK